MSFNRSMHFSFKGSFGLGPVRLCYFASRVRGTLRSPMGVELPECRGIMSGSVLAGLGRRLSGRFLSFIARISIDSC